MSVKISPTSTIKVRLGIEPNGKVQRYVQNACYRYMDKYVPLDEGGLRRNVDLSDPNKIVYESPHAHYMYEGKLYVMENGKGAYYSPEYGFWSEKGVSKEPTNKNLIYHTPGTGDHWDERMKSAEMESLINDVQNFINRGGK